MDFRLLKNKSKEIQLSDLIEHLLTRSEFEKNTQHNVTLSIF